MRVCIVAGTLLTILIAIGCTRSLYVTVSQPGNSVVVFEVNARKLFGAAGAAVTGFEVYRVKFDNTLEMVWGISAKDFHSPVFLKKITYGALSDGFKEMMSPKQLESGETYDFRASNAKAGAAGWGRFIFGNMSGSNSNQSMTTQLCVRYSNFK